MCIQFIALFTFNFAYGNPFFFVFQKKNITLFNKIHRVMILGKILVIIIIILTIFVYVFFFLLNSARNVYTTISCPNLAATEALPIPNNIDVAETTRFSPHRSRDISATVILSQNYQGISSPRIDITTDNTLTSSASIKQDPHVQSYDCFGAISLNSAMQSNVPTPFGGLHKFSHLNMPGGQWSQDNKFMSQNLQSSHYTALRKNVRSNWSKYNKNATIHNKGE